jgi:putative tricarboxylic transport membrane protein
MRLDFSGASAFAIGARFIRGEVMSFRILAAMVLAFTVACLGPSVAAAETAAEFYKGKVVKLVVGYSAGGGYDSYARLLAPHLEQRLGARVVVENRPGGGGNVALNQVAAAEPDGLVIMIISAAAAAFGQVMAEPGVRYDLAQMGFLGRVVDDKRVLVLNRQAGFETLDDMLRSDRPVGFGGLSRTTTMTASAGFVAEGLGLNAKIVLGYKGSKEVALAATRGEVDGFITSHSSASRYVRDDALMPFAVVSRERSALLPEVPTLFEMTTLSPEQAWWLDYCDALFGLGRLLVTPPDLPADRLAFLQEAVGAVLNDAGVIAESEERKLPIEYASPQDTRRLIEKVMSGLSADQLAKVRQVTLEKFN